MGVAPIPAPTFFFSRIAQYDFDIPGVSDRGNSRLKSSALQSQATEALECGSNQSVYVEASMASMSDKNQLEFQPKHKPQEGGNMDWKKTLMIGSFAAGAILFLTGRRPAGLAVAGIGVATFAAEHPEKFEELWHRMPEYIEKGSKFVDMASTFLERMGEGKSGYRNMPAASGSRY